MSRATRRSIGIAIAVVGLSIAAIGSFWLPDLVGRTIATLISAMIGFPTMLFGTFYARQRPWSGGRITRQDAVVMNITGVAVVIAGSAIVVFIDTVVLRFVGTTVIAVGMGLVISAWYRWNGTKAADAEADSGPAEASALL